MPSAPSDLSTQATALMAPCAPLHATGLLGVSNSTRSCPSLVNSHLHRSLSFWPVRFTTWISTPFWGPKYRAPMDASYDGKSTTPHNSFLRLGAAVGRGITVATGNGGLVAAGVAAAVGGSAAVTFAAAV